MLYCNDFIEFAINAADTVENFMQCKLIGCKCIKHMKYNFESLETTNISAGSVVLDLIAVLKVGS
jgi:hypothetical protein